MERGINWQTLQIVVGADGGSPVTSRYEGEHTHEGLVKTLLDADDSADWSCAIDYPVDTGVGGRTITVDAQGKLVFAADHSEITYQIMSGSDEVIVDDMSIAEALNHHCETIQASIVQLLSVQVQALRANIRLNDGTVKEVCIRELETSLGNESLIINGHEVSTNGSVIWVNSPSGMSIGRFSERGIDVHTDAETQVTKGVSCLACTHTKPTLEDWARFRALILEHYKVAVPVIFKPKWLQA